MRQHVGPNSGRHLHWSYGKKIQVYGMLHPIDLNLQKHCCDNLKCCIVKNRRLWTDHLYISFEVSPFPVRHTIFFSSHSTILFTQTLIVKMVTSDNHCVLGDIMPEGMHRKRAVSRQDGALRALILMIHRIYFCGHSEMGYVVLTQSNQSYVLHCIKVLANRYE